MHAGGRRFDSVRLHPHERALLRGIGAGLMRIFQTSYADGFWFVDFDLGHSEEVFCIPAMCRLRHVVGSSWTLGGVSGTDAFAGGLFPRSARAGHFRFLCTLPLGPPWLFRCELRRSLARRACPCVQEVVFCSQAKEGHLVDALVPRGDEGRGTLR